MRHLIPALLTPFALSHLRCALFLLPSLLVAEEPFPAPFNTDPAGESGPMPAAEAAAAFTLPDGFSASVFASEPDVQNPIAMAWDAKGRMWVAENYTYGSSKVRFQMRLRDRVLVFEDTDHDGKADRRTVFTDKVQMLTSVEVGHGGVFLMCPPQLLFIPDQNGDLVPDGDPVVVLDGFTVGKGNYHNFANGLRWGPDGWLYGRCGHSCPGRVGVPGTPDNKRVPIDGGIWRYHPQMNKVEVLCHGTVNPWGHDWDQHGELFFINTVIGHLWHMIPGAHFKESGSGGSQNPLVFERLDQHADHYHYDRGQAWSKSRDGAANDYGGGHSHIGMNIYQADHLPEYWRGKLLTWNQHGRRANVERLERRGSGYVAKHEPDAFLSGDTWFRGLDIRTGPDGALYALDWSDTGECHEHTGVHRTSGRIYKITHGKPAAPDFSVLGDGWKSDNIDTVRTAVGKIIRHPNVWFYRRWHLQLSGLEHAPLLPRVLREIVKTDKVTSHRLRAIWALHLRDMAEPESLLDDPDEHVRAWAIRLITETKPLDTIFGPIDDDFSNGPPVPESKFLKMATEDQSGLVRLALASALQRLPVRSRPTLAQALASRSGDAEDHNLPALVWYALIPLVDSDPAGLLKIAESTTWPDLLRWTSRALGTRIAENPEPVETMLEIAAADPKGKATPILTGLTEAFQGWRTAPKPKKWEEVAPALGESENARKLAVLFGDDIALGELEKIALDNKSPIPARQAALRTLIDKRPPDLRSLCERLLSTPRLNTVAVRGLAQFDDPAIAHHLAGNYQRLFDPEERPAVIEVLASRPTWSRDLLVGIERGRIPRIDLTPYHARQIQSFGDEKLTALLHQVWGRVAKSDGTKAKRMAELIKELSPEVIAAADLGRGRILFQNVCASCHLLYGEGRTLGPDLTGSGRADLTYLLENTLDPNAVVSAEYTMASLKLKDGRTLGGVIAAEDDRTLTLRMPTEDTTLEKSEITKRETLPDSIMPEGLLDLLSPDQRRDLLAYLMHPRQVALPK